MSHECHQNAFTEFYKELTNFQQKPVRDNYPNLRYQPPTPTTTLGFKRVKYSYCIKLFTYITEAWFGRCNFICTMCYKFLNFEEQ